MFVMKINHAKGTIVVSDINITKNQFKIKGFDAIASDGSKPTKFGWFRLKEFARASPDLLAKIEASFEVGTELKELEFGTCYDAERLQHVVVAKAPPKPKPKK